MPGSSCNPCLILAADARKGQKQASRVARLELQAIVRSTKSRDIKYAFVVSANDLRRLDGLLSAINADREYEVELSDGSTLYCPTVAEVGGVANVKDRAIRSIVARTRGTSEPQAQVRLRSSPWSFGNPSLVVDPIAYSVTGEDKEVLYHSNRLDEFAASIRQWYTRAAYADYVLGFFLTTIAAAMALVLFAGSSHLPNANERTESDGRILTVLIVSFLVLMLVLSLNALRNAVFPVATFAIGQGVARHNLLRSIRYVVATVVLLGLIVGILSGVLAARLVGSGGQAR